MKCFNTPLQAGITGFESPANEYIDIGLSLDELLVSHPSATFMGKASGNSMEGFGIFDGDLLIVDRAAPKSEFDIVAATLNGVFVCKGIQRRNRRLVSATPDYVYHPLSANDDYQEEGIVISSVRLHRISKKIASCMP